MAEMQCVYAVGICVYALSSSGAVPLHRSLVADRHGPPWVDTMLAALAL